MTSQKKPMRQKFSPLTFQPSGIRDLQNDPMPSRIEFDEALQHAQSIYDFVLNLLPAEAQT